MKRFLGFVFLAVISFGEEHFREEIRSLIEKVKETPPEERYKVMNELKLRLREMNQHEREEVIRRLYEEFHPVRHEREEGEYDEEKVKKGFKVENDREERFEGEREIEDRLEGRAEEHEERMEEREEERHEFFEERGQEKEEYLEERTEDKQEEYEEMYEEREEEREED